jgi:hypothetical protein
MMMKYLSAGSDGTYQKTAAVTEKFGMVLDLRHVNLVMVEVVSGELLMD